VTPTPALPCAPGPQVIPTLTANVGYWCTVQVQSSSRISAGWADNNDSRNQLLIIQGQPNPTGANLAIGGRSFGVLWALTNAPPAPTSCQPIGTYSVFFFNGADITTTTTGDVTLFNCGPGP